MMEQTQPAPFPVGRVALVHDWVTCFRGGEKVLDLLARIFPGAHLYTLVHRPGFSSPAIDALKIHSMLPDVPGCYTHFRKALPILPTLFERKVLKDYDVVISVSHSFAKAVRVERAAIHIVYCLTPIRYAWGQEHQYFGNGFLRAALEPTALAYLRRWDRRTSTPERIPRILSSSQFIADRVRRAWARESQVLYPGVHVDLHASQERRRGDYYLLVGAFVPYKAERLVVEAFKASGRRLVVAGDGPSRAALERVASRNIVFEGRVSDERLATLMAGCRALVHPQEEDFGMTAVEAQAAGAPVIAFGRGGATETVVAGPGEYATGLFFFEQTAEALNGAVTQFERLESGFNEDAIRLNARRFDSTTFVTGLARFLAEEVVARE